MAFRTVHYSISNENSANVPETPFSIVLLSDLHNVQIGSGNEKLLRTIHELSPSVIVSAGDLVTAKAGRSGVNHAAALVRELAADYPVYLIRGNHEMRMLGSGYPGVYDTYLSMIGQIRVAGESARRGSQSSENGPCRYMPPENGAVLLDDCTEYLNIHGMHIALSGYNVPLHAYRRGHGGDIAPEDIEAVLGSPDLSAYRILAAHHPDGFPAYADWGADLTLSGHIHGGVVRLPVLGGVVGASARLFPPYTRGMYELRCSGEGKEAVRRMVLSAGLGAHTIKLRINNPPELVCLDFSTHDQHENRQRG